AAGAQSAVDPQAPGPAGQEPDRLLQEDRAVDVLLHVILDRTAPSDTERRKQRLVLFGQRVRLQHRLQLLAVPDLEPGLAADDGDIAVEARAPPEERVDREPALIVHR